MQAPACWRTTVCDLWRRLYGCKVRPVKRKGTPTTARRVRVFHVKRMVFQMPHAVLLGTNPPNRRSSPGRPSCADARPATSIGLAEFYELRSALLESAGVSRETRPTLSLGFVLLFRPHNGTLVWFMRTRLGPMLRKQSEAQCHAYSNEGERTQPKHAQTMFHVKLTDRSAAQSGTRLSVPN